MADETTPTKERDASGAAGAFSDPRRYVAIPRLSGLAASGPGDRLVGSIAHLDSAGGRHVSAIWELDPAGGQLARRLTRSDKGERSPAFASDGSILFISDRPRPGGTDDDASALWRLPDGGGEPWVVAARPGAVTAVAAARDQPVVVFAAKVAPGGRDDPADEAWHKDRSDRKITAILHETLPVRQWDHEIGPEEVHYFAGVLRPVGAGGAGADASAGHTDTDTGLVEVRDLTPDAGQALQDARPVLSADGTTVVTSWQTSLPEGRVRVDVVAIEVATGARTVVASAPDAYWYYESPTISPDGRVACLAQSRGKPDEPYLTQVAVVDRAGGSPRHLDLGDLWPAEVTWSFDGRTLVVAGDRAGHHPLCLVDPDTSEVHVVQAGGSWTHPVPVADGGMFVLQSGIGMPPRPVRLDASGNAQAVQAPGSVPVPGRIEELSATAEDRTNLRAWLVLPDGASATEPAPLVLWVHGGPYGSWNDWSWRWNPWLMAARGWAVLLPDPALSTGYGLPFLQRGWRQWGGNPFGDLMALTDAAEQRDDIDESRTAAMGGSYGGYMANWIAGHTGRFKAIVSHASIWSLEGFQPTTDLPSAWSDQWGRPAEDPEFYRRWSPDAYVEAITSPMLVIHGVNDYRCPVSESVRLWTDLVEHGKVAKYLSFPDENHWILQPGDATVWYETVFAFLDHHVLGRPWERPSPL
ncbi:S9 family peptidase [Acidiferrimicrobium sp. IK]|uniref:S9 family peptidase n=1 Tax=Acidiferrimicrobium sp. IK TaxID=2871700 RepID=UPI0021CB31F9|nr:S9 family peptidase [Acidiferrimicrobium sp. IK]MCU4183942.1 S9 family peptidase [Acidiferrimicrobium sp. IK]